MTRSGKPALSKQALPERVLPDSPAELPISPSEAPVLDAVGEVVATPELAPSMSLVVVSSGAESEDRPPTLPFLVAGIGFGELGALGELLANLEADLGIAFVLMPAAKTGVPIEVIAALTALPVHAAAAGLLPQPDQVYVAPPDTVLRIEGGVFVVAPRDGESPDAQRLDVFLRSLASDVRNRAIGVVLRGCGSDGLLGRKAVKGEGGIAIVQSDGTPRRDAVPHDAATTDYIDLILAPAQIGQELGRIARQVARMRAASAEQNADEPLLDKIYGLLQRSKKVDFSFYKQTTLRRRIARRMVVKRIDTLQEYVRLVQHSGTELKDLYEDMLINVTRFFRDAETFAALRSELIPLILQDRPAGEAIRIWVPGCATGEEVYSLAMTFLEHLGALSIDLPLQLFGTDISDQSIELARRAVYRERLVADVSAERLRRFFVKVDGGYQVNKRLRDMCVFARQNLACDPPFSRLDMISCRNVLIYFGATLQKSIMPAFHYALKPTGFLLLGTSETLRDYANLFILLDKRHRLYTKNPTAGRTALQLSGRTAAPEFSEVPHPERMGPRLNEGELQHAADRMVLARFGPAGVIINEQAEILQSRGHTSPFIELPSGTATLNLLRMVRDNIAIALREGISRAVANNIPVRLDALQLLTHEGSSSFAVEILPILSPGQLTRCFLVLFIPQLPPPPATPAPPAVMPLLAAPLDDKDKQILQLRNDLGSSKLYLQSLLEEREIANQELISANEEIQSNNEELHSINEELETAKEELQSTNEELQMVNDELYNRNLELGQTSNDLLNLLNNITIPVLLLDSELRIRQFTPIAERMMNVRSADIGRPIGEIRLNLNVDDLEPLLSEVIESLTTKELEVQDRAGRWHLLRARPYRTTDNKIDGVVVVLVEVDQIRKTQQQLMEARDFAQAVVANAQVPLAVLDRELRIKTANRSFHALCGLPPREVEGRLLHDVTIPQWNLQPIWPLLETLNTEPVGQAEFELEHVTGGAKLQVLQVNARAIMVDNQWLVLLAVQDITARKLAEQLLQREKKRLEGKVALTELALDRTQEELRALAASLFRAQEEERRRVARELHDDLAQKVALLDLTTERIDQGLRALSADSKIHVNVSTQMEELREQITDLALDLRRIAYQLHPTILDDLGLYFALKQLSEEFALREGLPVHFSCRTPPEVPVTIGGALYRITQEALRNIAKHAGKTPIEITLLGSPRELRLRIRDHGKGFEPGEARSRGGMGILNMEERVRLLGGRFTLKASPGKGVAITVRVALPGAE